MQRARGALAVAAVVAGLLAACSSSPGRPTSAPPVGWATGVADAANGSPGPIDAAAVCGSTTDQFLVELLHHPVTDLKVMYEWGSIPAVPRPGRQLLVSGIVATVHQGPGDLPMDHPLGDDLSMDVTVDAPFKPFAMKLGSAPSDTKPGQFHVEISSGFIPHLPLSAAAPAGQTWRQLSDESLTGFQPGFDHPAVGDPVLVAGRYIIDCGHPEYSTELHPISFLAWSHQSGFTTSVHVYANNYWDTELFNPDLSLLGKVGDTARQTAADTKPLPKYLIDEVTRLITGRTDRIRAFELVGAVAPVVADFQVCAPAGSTGKHLTLRYDVQTRPGINVAFTPNASAGCTAVHTSANSAFAPADVALRTCVLPWNYLNAIAAGALSTAVDTRQVIKNNLLAKYYPLVDRDPLTTCADPLSGPPVSATPAAQSVRSNPSQPFPLYGVITVTRS